MRGVGNGDGGRESDGGTEGEREGEGEGEGESARPIIDCSAPLRRYFASTASLHRLYIEGRYVAPYIPA